MFRKILVGYDASAGADRALEAACHLAKESQAQVWALAVLEHLPKYAASIGEIEETRAQGEAYLRSVLTRAQEQALGFGIELQVDQMAGQPAEAIVKYAREKSFDLIVLGHSGHSGIWGSFLGTTTDKAVRHAHCTVMAVR
jgi:nucleotide-binding universal stress UspA family protein